MNFFITGLPRSRTAWLAVVATTGAAICHHEPRSGDFASARDLWASGDGVGISDAGLGLHLSRILAEIGPRVLIVDRDPDAVLASFERFAPDLVGEPAALRFRLAQLQAALAIEHPLIRRVSFDALHDQQTVADAMSWLGVAPLNLPQMMHLNVQSDLGHTLAKLRVA